MNSIDPTEELILAARGARSEAYAPYSGYPVGAAILDTDGRLWTGCNIENVSHGATMCAERVALFKMVSAGLRTLQALALSTLDGGTPCGICLQVLSEFATDPAGVSVVCASDQGTETRYTLLELLPHAFDSAALKRTEPPTP